MNVLVTGGAGFLGGYIMAALLRQGHDAFAYDVAPPSAETLAVSPDTAVRFRSGQISDIARLFAVCRAEKIEAIIHSAGMVGLELSLEQPIATYQTNVMGLVNVCEVARQLEMRRVVFVSSNAAYHKGSGATLVETDPAFSIRDANPAGHYGTSKMVGEAIGLAYANFQDLDFLAIRVTAIYGFGMRFPMYVKPMVENSVLGKPTRFATGGRMKRDYTHVLDCAGGIVAALNAPPWKAGEQRVINVANGNARTAAEVASIVRDTIPGADIEIGDELTPLEEQNVKMRTSLDNAAAKRLLNWSPQWPLEKGIAEYAETFRRHLSRTSTS
ncbi:NAD(P)-dependent oxidoreductase [Bradyrhizobium sp.]|uniref:NAD-dependent epimerase/dehydratase family protein n=1 Tax=Bradyrhizobium sp. TaxID=376 RepID=UPI002D3E99F3|nr:NAD(P)-dependent oxidoreductase [Bradyrhizobium sp.]HZR71960.1 NAD(P)-dependent oxidoreductase [Bradyrhizobium sp.]